MSAPIAPISLSIPPIAGAAAPASQTTSGSAFQSVLAEAVSKVEGVQANAQDSINKFLSGEGEELHQVAMRTQEAELSFDLFMQLRNKVVSAYQEVMRMQV